MSGYGRHWGCGGEIRSVKGFFAPTCQKCMAINPQYEPEGEGEGEITIKLLPDEPEHGWSPYARFQDRK